MFFLKSFALFIRVGPGRTLIVRQSYVVVIAGIRLGTCYMVLFERAYKGFVAEV